MKITVDTNVLVRAVVQDDKRQAKLAVDLLKSADIIAVAGSCLSEFVWVLRRVYGFGQSEISAAITALLAAGNVVVDRPAVDAGLAVLDAGGDFADGLIAYQGRWLGGENFVSFDKKAVSLLAGHGSSARLLE
ncbi:MAG: VapC toxin family PIN domain ribonuclease [Acidiphilium sp. 37-64-53]|uniref:type II toxin-antitoxin system VapC family toxin n=1 Tax=Acidiphilium TaxID=522 RepID=UPI000BD8D296|nr:MULTISPECIES: type II toxin-antitoxin system VapC family toxin [Acidiphilium]OYW04198.1 MAG: VapC toxin family PIN domain ribonuclease [Acidiphilium sp. 37-64-53]OZB31129.1 MAG: VapC toxin family PIN domain ribonuclease [Acidiphilium sp. 34-64-41]HQT83447.1 type II toxin-antitoxin system VapC family toxin [Acidiphilium rubrum]